MSRLNLTDQMHHFTMSRMNLTDQMQSFCSSLVSFLHSIRMDNILLPLGALCVFLCYLLYQWACLYLARSRYIRQNGCLPPKRIPQKDPILGLDLFFEILKQVKANRRLESIKFRFEKYGNTFQSTSFGTTVISTAEPKNIQAVLATHFKSFGMGPFRSKSLGPFVGKGIFSSDGEFWEHSRALIRPAFARTQVADLDAFELHLSRFIDILPKDGSTVDLQPLFGCLFLDSSTEFLFGESVDSLLPHTSMDSKRFLEAIKYAQYGTGRRVMLGRFRVLYRDRKYWEACKTIHNFADKFVNKAIEYRETFDLKRQYSVSSRDCGRYIFLNELAKETGDKIELRDQLLNVFLAGHDSTAVVLSHLFFSLSRYPKVWEKLRAEILTSGLGKSTFESLKDMTYLRYCINETLRLYPVIPLNARMALQDTMLPLGGGADGKSPIFVKKGQNVVYHIYSSQRSKEIYGPDAEEFRPERWEKTRPGWSYVPFSGGPRACIGQQLALTQASYATVRLMQAFQAIESRDSEPWQEVLKLTLSSKNGVLVGLVPA